LETFKWKFDLILKVSVYKDQTTVVDAVAKAKLFEVLGTLDSMLEQNEWLVGDCVTIADLAILATVSTIIVSGFFVIGR
jgi:glutathione S-transferase